MKDLLFVPYMLIAFLNTFKGLDNKETFLKIVFYPWLISWVFQNLYYTPKYYKQIIRYFGLSVLLVGSYIFFNQGTGEFDISLQYILSRSRQGFIYVDGPDFPIGPTQISALFGLLYITIIIRLKNNIGYKIPLLFLLLYTVLIIIVLSSRTTWIYMFLITLFMLFRGNKFFKFKYIFMALLFIPVVMFLANFITPYFSKYFQTEVILERLEFLSNPTDGVHMGSRLLRWALTVSALPGNYFGKGFSFFDKEFDLQTPHNEYLAQMLAVGFVGFAFWIMIYYNNFKAVFTTKFKNKYYNEFAMLFAIQIFFTSLTEHYAYGMKDLLHPMIWIFFGIAYGRVKEQKVTIDNNKVINASNT